MPDILTPIRVSELPEASSVSDTDLLIIDNGEQTQKIPVGTFNEEATGSAKRYADEALLSAQNAETQAQAASGSATIAGNHAQDANKSAQDAEALAVGKRNGADVPSTDDAYHNNAKYFSEQAHASATEAAGSADDAAQSAASISGLEDQIEQNTEDVTALKSAVDQVVDLKNDEVDRSAFVNMSGYYIGGSVPHNIAAASGVSLMYVPCSPNTLYVIDKVVSNRFQVAYTTETPRNGVLTYGWVQKNSASEVKFTTGSDAAFLVVYYKHSSDTLDESTIYNSIHIYERVVDVRVVRFDMPQELTREEQEQAQANIGLDEIQPGLSDEAITALLNCFAHVAWIDNHGKQYYDALQNALKPDLFPKITVDYEPGSHVVYDTDTLDSLKPYLTVTYFESEEAEGTIVPSSNYTLLGTLQAGTSTITVYYNEMFATVAIPVSTHYLYRMASPTVFNGTDTKVQTGLHLFTEERTFSIAFDAQENEVDYANNRYVLFLCSTVNNWFQSYLGYSGTKTVLAWQVSGQNNQMNIDSTAVGNHHIRGAFSHTAETSTYELDLYVDGVQFNAKGYATKSYTYHQTDAELLIGCDNPSADTYSRFFKGTINEFVVLDYALTAAQVSQYARGGSLS